MFGYAYYRRIDVDKCMYNFYIFSCMFLCVFVNKGKEEAEADEHKFFFLPSKAIKKSENSSKKSRHFFKRYKF